MSSQIKTILHSSHINADADTFYSPFVDKKLLFSREELRFIEILLSGALILNANYGRRVVDNNNEDDEKREDAWIESSEAFIDILEKGKGIFKKNKHNKAFIELFLREIKNKKLSAQESRLVLYFIMIFIQGQKLPNKRLDEAFLEQQLFPPLLLPSKTLFNNVNENKDNKDLNNKFNLIRYFSFHYNTNFLILPPEYANPHLSSFSSYRLTYTLNLYLTVSNPVFFREEEIVDRLSKLRLFYFESKKPTMREIKKICEENSSSDITTIVIGGKGFNIEELSFMIHHLTRTEIYCFPYHPSFVEENRELGLLFKNVISKIVARDYYRNCVLTASQLSVELTYNEFKAISDFCSARIKEYTRRYNEKQIGKEELYFIKSYYYSLLNITLEIIPKTRYEEQAWHFNLLQYQNINLEQTYISFIPLINALQSLFPLSKKSVPYYIELSKIAQVFQDNCPQDLFTYSKNTIKELIKIADSLYYEINNSILIPLDIPKEKSLEFRRLKTKRGKTKGGKTKTVTNNDNNNNSNNSIHLDINKNTDKNVGKIIY